MPKRRSPSKRRPFDIRKSTDGKNNKEWICYDESLDPHYFWTREEAEQFRKSLMRLAALSHEFCTGKKNPARGVAGLV